MSLVLALCNRAATAIARSVGSERRIAPYIHVRIATKAGEKYGPGLNILPDDAPGEPSFNGGIHGFQSYPLLIAPRIIDCLTAQVAVEKVH